MQQNKENRSFKIITAIALCVAVLCLSVAYAALSQSLKIQGTAEVVATDWSIDGPGDEEIKPKDPSGKGGDGDMTGEITDNGEGVITVDITATLKKPGDFAEIEIPITNNGDIDAHLSAITGLESNIECAGTGGTADADKGIMCTNAGQATQAGPGFIYTISYGNTVVYKSNESSSNGLTNVTNKNLTKNGGNETVKVKVEFDQAATKVPTANVTVTLPTITFAFAQGLSS